MAQQPFSIWTDPATTRPAVPDPEPVEPPARLRMRGAWSPHDQRRPLPAVTSAEQRRVVYPLREVVAVEGVDGVTRRIVYTLSCGHTVTRPAMHHTLVQALYCQACGGVPAPAPEPTAPVPEPEPGAASWMVAPGPDEDMAVWCRQVRVSLGLRQRELGDWCGLGPCYWSKYEHGHRRPTPWVIQRVLELLRGQP